MASGKVVGQATVGLEPDAVAVTPNGTLALVANFGDNTVTPLSLPSPAARATRSPSDGSRWRWPSRPKGDLALVSNYEDGSVSPIALPGLTVGPPVPAGLEPTAVFITPDGATALVADFQTSTVTPINLSTMAPGAADRRRGQPHRHRRRRLRPASPT